MIIVIIIFGMLMWNNKCIIGFGSLGFTTSSTAGKWNISSASGSILTCAEFSFWLSLATYEYNFKANVWDK